MQADILVIEDEEAINDLICMNLEAVGYHTVPFFDGGRVRSHLKENSAYDLAILDVMLPDMDGFEVCKAIREFSICFLASRSLRFCRLVSERK